MKNFLLTRFPYFFYIPLSETAELDLDKKTVTKTQFDENGEILEVRNYKIEPLKTAIFLCIKYLPILFILLFIYTKYDFVLSSEKITQYAVAFGVAFLILYFFKFIYLILGLALVVSAVFFIDDIAYILKYFFTFLIFLSLVLELDLQVFNVYKDEKLVGQILVKKENNV